MKAININNALKNIALLSSILMSSNKVEKLILWKVLLKKNTNLGDFTIIGFDTSKAKSMRKLFYQSGISVVTLLEINTENAEDFSYMFASIEAPIIEISKLNANKAINISHTLGINNT